MKNIGCKNYTVSLKKIDAENLKTWLEPQGISFSSYLQMLISDTMKAVGKFVDEGKTPVLTSSALLEFARQMAKEEERNAEKAKRKKRL